MSSDSQSINQWTIAIVSNGKKNTKPFFDFIETELRDNHGVADVERLTKSNMSAPVEAELLEQSEKWQALIAGIGD